MAAARSCSLHVQMNVTQVSSKDDEGEWVKNTAVSLAWDAQASGVVSIDTGRNDVPELMAYIGSVVHVELALASGEMNSDKGQILLAGDAVLSDVSLTAQNRQNGTYDITLTGRKNSLFDLRALVTADGHLLVTSDDHFLAAWHENV